MQMEKNSLVFEESGPSIERKLRSCRSLKENGPQGTPYGTNVKHGLAGVGVGGVDLLEEV